MEAMHSWKFFLITGEKLEFNPPAGPEPSPSPAPSALSPATVPASFPGLANSSYYLSMDLLMVFTAGQTRRSPSLQDRQTAGQRDGYRPHPTSPPPSNWTFKGVC